MGILQDHHLYTGVNNHPNGDNPLEDIMALIAQDPAHAAQRSFERTKHAREIISTDFTGPNGIAFSPDEKFLYVWNWDETNKVVFRYPVNSDATLGNGRLFFDMTAAPGEDAIDGIKVDQHGNLYVSGPGGLWILSAEGKHLGTLDRKSTRLNSSHLKLSRMPSSA